MTTTWTQGPTRSHQNHLHLTARTLQRLGGLACLVIGLVVWEPQPTHSVDLQSLTSSEREALEAVIFDYIMDNPEVIVDSLQSFQQAMETQARDADSTTIARLHEDIFNSPAAWSGGNPDGDVTIVEFLDYRCGYCRQMFEIVNRVVATDGNIRYVVKEFPILGEESMFMARLALAIRDLAGDEAYKAVHDTMMTRDDLEPSDLEEIAARSGLDPVTLTKGIMSDAVSAALAESYSLAEELGINGTPAFIIGSQIIRGALTEDRLTEVIAMSREDSGIN